MIADVDGGNEWSNEHVAVVEMCAEERVEPALESEDVEGREEVTRTRVMGGISWRVDQEASMLTRLEGLDVGI